MTETQRAYQQHHSNPMFTTPTDAPRGINPSQAIQINNPQAQRKTNPMPPKITYPIGQPYSNQWAGTHGPRPGAITSRTANLPFNDPESFQGARSFYANPNETPYPINMKGAYAGYSYGF